MPQQPIFISRIPAEFWLLDMIEHTPRGWELQVWEPSLHTQTYPTVTAQTSDADLTSLAHRLRHAAEREHIGLIGTFTLLRSLRDVLHR